MDIQDFFERIESRFGFNLKLTKGEIEFLIDAVTDYGRDEDYWPKTLTKNFEEGKYN